MLAFNKAAAELSIAYQVLCEYTAWYAVDRSGKEVEPAGR